MKKKIITYGILIYSISTLLLLIKQKQSIIESKYDCIVILGNSPNLNSKPNPFLKSRLKTGIELLEQGVSKKLILTGAKKKSKLSEAEIMKRYCLDNNVSEKDIILEESALSTKDNLEYSSLLMKKLDFKNALVVTSSHHVKRTNRYCEILEIQNFEVVASRQNLITILTLLPLTILEMFKLKNADR